jgi:hypothetical protein
MLKIRIIAAIISLALTALTLYIAPKIYFAYVHWSESLTPEQQNWFNGSQIMLGGLLAAIGFWLWKKQKSKK